MQNFNFTRLVKKYSSDFTVVTYLDSDKKEYDDRGYLVKGEKKEITLNGAIISRGESVIFRSDGNLTEKDKRLFMLAPIDEALLNAKVVYEDDLYTIQRSTDNSKFTGVWAYVMKYVSAFKGGDGK